MASSPAAACFSIHTCILIVSPLLVLGCQRLSACLTGVVDQIRIGSPSDRNRIPGRTRHAHQSSFRNKSQLSLTHPSFIIESSGGVMEAPTVLSTASPKTTATSPVVNQAIQQHCQAAAGIISHIHIQHIIGKLTVRVKITVPASPLFRPVNGNIYSLISVLRPLR